MVDVRARVQPRVQEEYERLRQPGVRECEGKGRIAIEALDP